jgi:hypothetical protein
MIFLQEHGLFASSLWSEIQFSQFRKELGLLGALLEASDHACYGLPFQYLAPPGTLLVQLLLSRGFRCVLYIYIIHVIQLYVYNMGYSTKSLLQFTSGYLKTDLNCYLGIHTIAGHTGGPRWYTPDKCAGISVTLGQIIQYLGRLHRSPANAKYRNINTTMSWYTEPFRQKLFWELFFKK